MKAFNDIDFLLFNHYGKKLYHQVAAALPIIDPHNHIDPSALAANKQFENIYQLWVQHDPYKHRAMRIYGIAEDLITGNQPDYEKFTAWATCFPATAGNPLFHWCCMELKELFGITEMLNPSTVKQIWDEANNKLTQGSLGALDIIKKLSVEMLCTSDDLTDSLEYHIALGKQQKEVTCLPSLRSDSIVAFNQSSFFTWVEKLQTVSGICINNLETYKTAIVNRLNFFDEAGCLLSDHSFDSGFKYVSCNSGDAESIFDLILKKEIGKCNCILEHIVTPALYYEAKWGLQVAMPVLVIRQIWNQ
jgi:glucuronate isomerase